MHHMLFGVILYLAESSSEGEDDLMELQGAKPQEELSSSDNATLSNTVGRKADCSFPSETQSLEDVRLICSTEG